MPKISPPIDVATLKALKKSGKPVEVADGGCPGLRIRVGVGGTMTWSLMARDSDGVRRRIELGDWPDVGVPQARELAGAMKATIRRESRLGEKNSTTFAELLLMYGKGPGAELKSWSQMARGVVLVFDKLMDTRLGDLRGPLIQDCADTYRSKSHASFAIRSVRPVLKWAAKRHLVSRDIINDLEQVSRTNPRERVLTRGELGRVLNALGSSGYDRAVLMLLLTGCRLREVCDMRYEEIEGDVWVIPGARRKNGQTLRVPMSSHMKELVAKQGGSSGRVFPGRGGCAIYCWSRWQPRFFERSDTSGWHRHDLRRTAATLLGEAGVAPHVIEIFLGHAAPHSALASIYNKSRYDKEHLEALEKLGDILKEIELEYMPRKRAEELRLRDIEELRRELLGA